MGIIALRGRIGGCGGVRGRRSGGRGCREKVLGWKVREYWKFSDFTVDINAWDG